MVGAVVSGAGSEKFSTHAEPVWRERSDFIINAPLAEAGRFEQLWVEKVGENQFRVCCIPFFLYDLALGDVVETAAQGERRYVFSRVLMKSGRYVFRAYFERPQYRFRDASVEELGRLDALVEWSSPSLLAIDACDHAHAQLVADYLQEQESAGRLMYETGKTT